MLKRTFISDYTVEPTGAIQIKITIQVAHDDGKGIRNLNHRTTILPGTDPEAQIAAVNVNLADMNAALLGAADAEFIISLTNNIHTKDMVEAFASRATVQDVAPVTDVTQL